MPIDVASLNAVRRRVQALWDSPGPRPRPMIQLVDEDGEREEIGDTFRTIASEMGLRYIRLDLASGLTPDHVTALAKASKQPRLILITSIDGMPVDARPSLHDSLCEGAARTLPIVVCFLPRDVIDSTMAAAEELRKIEARRARDREIAKQHGFELED